MPDISMCVNDKCPSKDKCHRYTAKPDEYWQSYSPFRFNEKTGKCRDFWDNKNERR